MSAANNVLFDPVAAAIRAEAVEALTAGFPNHRQALSFLPERRILSCGFHLVHFEFKADCSRKSWMAARESIMAYQVDVAPVFSLVFDQGYNEDYIIFPNRKMLALAEDEQLNKDKAAVRSAPGRRNADRSARPDNIIWIPYKRC